MKIHAAGCCLLDYLYRNCSFSAPQFAALQSREYGDGGIVVGGLVFSEDLEQFAGKPYSRLLQQLSGGREPDAVNLGGPAIVAAIGAAQILGSEHEVEFFGITTPDDTCSRAMEVIAATPVQFTTVREIQAGVRYPTTDVFSDPRYHDGAGERSFVNTIGAAGYIGMGDLPGRFFDADLLLLGGTALLPRLHAELPEILGRAKAAGCLTVVGTVYDFFNEKKRPGQPWPLTERLSDIDLLVMDEEEALKISGTDSVTDAQEYFSRSGTGACVISRGAKGSLVYSSGARFHPVAWKAVPVCRAVDEELEAHPERRGDTTGCGDNFLGGITASLCRQLAEGTVPDLLEAVAWGTVAGGFACYYLGGTYSEAYEGQKRKELTKLFAQFSTQL